MLHVSRHLVTIQWEKSPLQSLTNHSLKAVMIWYFFFFGITTYHLTTPSWKWQTPANKKKSKSLLVIFLYHTLDHSWVSLHLLLMKWGLYMNKLEDRQSKKHRVNCMDLYILSTCYYNYQLEESSYIWCMGAYWARSRVWVTLCGSMYVIFIIYFEIYFFILLLLILKNYFI